MHLFFTDQRKVWKVGQVAGLSQAELSALFTRRLVPSGTPILLDEAMRPVEPVSSWFRSLALERKDAKTMRSYAYSVLMLHFLLARGTDLQSVTEADLREFRLWRQDAAGTTGRSPSPTPPSRPPARTGIRPRPELGHPSLPRRPVDWSLQTTTPTCPYEAILIRSSQ
ncbi:hypothetical protein ACFV19_32920 [Streptomyces griseoluteus]|uniref:hypothetical protein n=1 Tax=Streptomyces griseoluteus TaxID=29306 RepID=UPI0036CF9CAB